MSDRRALWGWAGTVRGFRAILAAQWEMLVAESANPVIRPSDDPGYWARRAWWAEYWLLRTDDAQAIGRLEQQLAEARAMLRELEQRQGVGVAG